MAADVAVVPAQRNETLASPPQPYSFRAVVLLHLIVVSNQTITEGMATKTVDLELKKAFGELQHKMTDTAQKLKLADMQIDGLKKSKIHTELTVQEIKSMPPKTNTYESVGRMFILRDMPEITQDLQLKAQKYEEKIKTLENNKVFLERNLKEAENNLREMVQQRKA